jgi:hypothetical protein
LPGIQQSRSFLLPDGINPVPILFDFTTFTWTHICGKKQPLPEVARSEFMGILKHVADIKGKVVGLIDRFYPSSKSCSDCGEINHRLTVADRRWVCAGCGSVHDREGVVRRAD